MVQSCSSQSENTYLAASVVFETKPHDMEVSTSLACVSGGSSLGGLSRLVLGLDDACDSLLGRHVAFEVLDEVMM